jgi:hypothetical protein
LITIDIITHYHFGRQRIIGDRRKVNTFQEKCCHVLSPYPASTERSARGEAAPGWRLSIHVCALFLTSNCSILFFGTEVISRTSDAEFMLSAASGNNPEACSKLLEIEQLRFE